MRIPTLVFPIVLAMTSPSMAQDAGGIFDKLGSTNVDILTYGIQALQTNLNLMILDLCQKGCEDAHRSYSVSYLPTKPKGFPEGMKWLDGGMLAVRMEMKRNGTDTSMVSEKVCRSDIGIAEMSEELIPLGNFGAYFVPYKDAIHALYVNKSDSPTRQAMNSIRDRIVLVLYETMTINDAAGMPTKMVWVNCTKSLTSDEIYVTDISN